MAPATLNVTPYPATTPAQKGGVRALKRMNTQKHALKDAVGPVVALEVAASVVVAHLASLDQHAECRSQMDLPRLRHPGKVAVVSALFLVPSRLW